MKNLITILLVLMVSVTNAQVYINISNNTFITFDGGITVTLDSQTPNTISKIGNVGGILTNSENDKLRWNIGNATGQFYVPFSSSFGNTIPFIYDITSGGDASGYIDFTTYGTNIVNNPLPTTVTSVSDDYGTNNSNNVIDRFWVINTDQYTNKPIGEYTFTYDDNDVVGNTIDETLLVNQRWNDVDNKWGDWLYSPTADITNNTITITIANPEDQYNIWTMVDQGSPLAITITRFVGYCIDQNTRSITIETATEELGDTFNIERSYNGIDFTPFRTIPSDGNVGVKTITDDQQFDGNVYYRLNNNVIVITCQADEETNIRPNPNNGTFIIGDKNLRSIIIYDQLGKTIYQNDNLTSNIITLDNATNGLYYAKINNNKTFKIVVSK
mgnify:FL=1